MSHQCNDAMCMVQEAVGEQMLKAAQSREQKMDEEIQKLENLDEDDFEKLRQARRERLMKQQVERQEWLQNDHGRYTEIGDQQQFFDATKKSKRMVAHFYRAATQRCQIVDRHLGDLAPRHLETRFVKIDAEKSPFLVERLNIFMMPTVLCIKEGKVAHHLRGFDELGGHDDFPTAALACALAAHGVLNYEGPDPGDADEDQLAAEDDGAPGGGPPSALFSSSARRNPIRRGDHERSGRGAVADY
uniref:Thioredoxin domain-containing protein n=1 Tax=Heterosigma akashiwo TaxID=2829 RepID=A0A6V1PIS8_HETAK|mmetsp:Transcript_36444/g.53381  ORF Transcript_36444/g.53381 Transcript_36444/m.53381 type:complete len:245 (-) Transcript_36444:33-767(-)|eukprot:CAMPEP_0194558830 /NCGR_PEP_ID=MMETSP0292-20121207/600_1 /TAXON_ID=39354 /ORGANISM="Heterosigma akashiwo, Strain CCMP2393" /LENGTH=244 /DNA_ID=CAMNT_0039406581 /DNA_START=74 /DNA_END=808 /DNA_ORIENTATION=-